MNEPMEEEGSYCVLIIMTDYGVSYDFSNMVMGVKCGDRYKN